MLRAQAGCGQYEQQSMATIKAITIAIVCLEK
jgi:hypothetical protein